MQSTNEQAPILYSHTRRPTWGFAILAKEDREERQFQFQDGQLRTFKRGYYELMEEVGSPPPRAIDIVRDLQAMLRIERGRRLPGPMPKVVERAVPWDEQLRLFQRLFPQGFEDPRWIARVRGGEDARRLKRHRAVAISEARAQLAAEVLERAIDEDPRAVTQTMLRILGASDLAGSKDTAPLRKAAAEQHAPIARALFALLWGEGPLPARFDAWVAALRRASKERVSWPVATALLGLVHPSAQVPVKPSVFRQQAQWMAPALEYDPSPSSALYAELLAMTEAVKARLEQSGYAPRDLLDVYDFMVSTLRPRALAQGGADAEEP